MTKKSSKVDVENIHPSISVGKSKVVDVINSILKEEGVECKHINVIFVDDPYISRLNREFLGREGPTDVMAFLLGDEGERIEGEIYVSLDRAWDQAEEYGVELEEEIHRLVIHGVLHLLGYEDRSLREKTLMTQKQEGYLKSLTKP